MHHSKKFLCWSGWLILPLIAAIFLWNSCSSVLVKRHYRDGYHLVNSQYEPAVKKQQKTIEFTSAEHAIGSQTNELVTVHEEAFDETQNQIEIPLQRFPAQEKNQGITRFTLEDIQENNIGRLVASHPEKANWHLSGNQLALATGLIFLLILLIFPFRRLSEWASKHKRSSQLLILASSPLLGMGAYVFGAHLAKNAMALPQEVFQGSTLLFLATILFYPNKKGIFKTQQYKARKFADVMLLSTALLGICYQGRLLISEIPSTDANIVGQYLFQSGRYLFEKMNTFFQVEPGPNSFWYWVMAIGLVLLVLSIAFMALFLAAALSCNLSCSGNEGGAMLIGLGGTLLAISLFTVGLKIIIERFRQHG